MSPNQSYTLNNIQALRALAAIMVILHHALPHYEAMGGNLVFIHFISEWGFVGVDIFFIISGFIMAYTTFHKERNIASAKTFFKHRLYRIYLGYWPFFFAMLSILLVIHSPRLETINIIDSFMLSNIDMFQLVLPVSWSLSYELYFYFLFLFTFLFSIKKLYIIIPLFIIFILSLVLYSFFNPTLSNHFIYSHFLLEFFAGVLLYMYKEYLMKTWILLFSLLCVIIALYYGISYENKNGFLRVLTFGSAAFFIVLSALILEEKKFYRAKGLFVLLGNASYTLYLSHLVIIELFYLTGLRDLFTHQHILSPIIGLLLLIILCIIFSILYYQKIEKPIYKKAIHWGKIS